MNAAILISGAGQLGSRYLQGLAKCHVPLRIYVHDKIEASLDRAKLRWNEVLNSKVAHEVSFHTSLDLLPRQIDIAIVATTADVRPQVVGEIAHLVAVRFWVLEKVLAQSEEGLDALLSYVREGAGAWVNTARRAMPWHQQIKSQLGLAHPMILNVGGGEWGLACNAVHYLDLFAWWSGETLQSINTDSLAPSWFEGKRRGFWEVFGTLDAQFSGGGQVHLTAREDAPPQSITVSDSQRSWQINEAQGLANRSDGMVIKGGITHQSERSGALVESILEKGDCDLTTLEESAALHRIFISSMLGHWKRAGHPAATFVPIT